ncbi:MAG: hypothetical protein Q8Q08_10665 [Candidatus Omnitrophota bacterium]|nr:hypothetical protein [Candidatus Omnitrophota bacterium]
MEMRLFMAGSVAGGLSGDGPDYHKTHSGVSRLPLRIKRSGWDDQVILPEWSRLPSNIPEKSGQILFYIQNDHFTTIFTTKIIHFF